MKLEPGMGLLVKAMNEHNVYNIWEITKVHGDTRVTLRCPFGKTSPISGDVEPDEEVFPNVVVAISVARLRGATVV
jgi:hypothetical protein